MDDSKKSSSTKDAGRCGEAPRKRLAGSKTVASVRVSPGGYLAAASILTFASVLLLRAENNFWALAALAAAWLAMPALAFTDRIAFDGQSLTRRGPAPFLLQLISGRRQRLSLTDFERVDTNAVRTLRRGRPGFRYRLSQPDLRPRQSASSSLLAVRAIGKWCGKLFPLISDQKVDSRTRELRDHLCEPGFVCSRH